MGFYWMEFNIQIKDTTVMGKKNNAASRRLESVNNTVHKFIANVGVLHVHSFIKHFSLIYLDVI